MKLFSSNKNPYIIYCIFYSLLIFIAVLSCFLVMHRSDKDKIAKITKLNDTYKGKIVEITATDITIDDSYTDDEGVMDVGVSYIINNISNSDNYYTSKEGIKCSADGMQCYGGYGIDFDKPGEGLVGSISPGNYSVGYYHAIVPKNTKTVEMQFEDGYKNYVYFSFDITNIEY